MESPRTRILLILAIFISVFLAGGNIDRAFVAMPAWEEVGAIAWAEFSRYADLGNGLIFYPLEALVGARRSAARSESVSAPGPSQAFWPAL